MEDEVFELSEKKKVSETYGNYQLTIVNNAAAQWHYWGGIQHLGAVLPPVEKKMQRHCTSALLTMTYWQAAETSNVQYNIFLNVCVILTIDK